MALRSLAVKLQWHCEDLWVFVLELSWVLYTMGPCDGPYIYLYIHATTTSMSKHSYHSGCKCVTHMHQTYLACYHNIAQYCFVLYTMCCLQHSDDKNSISKGLDSPSIYSGSVAGRMTCYCIKICQMHQCAGIATTTYRLSYHVRLAIRSVIVIVGMIWTWCMQENS